MTYTESSDELLFGLVILNLLLRYTQPKDFPRNPDSHREEMNSFGGLTSTALLLLMLLVGDLTSLSSSSPMLLLVQGLSSSSPSPPPPSTKKYYTYKTFKRLGVPALIYSAFSRATAKLARMQPKTILPKKRTSSTVLGNHRKVAVVTGSNTGVGFETARALVQEHGMQVIIACRSMEKGLVACDKINGNLTHIDSDGKAVFIRPLDLVDLDSVRSFGQAVLEQYETIDVLVNNAGRNSAGESDKREDSLDVIFTTNFLGHFLLTNLLLEKCRRIVNLASVMHHFPKNDESDDVCTEEYWRNAAIEPGEGACDGNGSVVPRKTYSSSKLAALFFSIELNRRFGERRGIRSIAVNPGSVYVRCALALISGKLCF